MSIIRDPSRTVIRSAIRGPVTGNQNLVQNGGFHSDIDWVKGANWIIAAGVASHSAGATAVLSQGFATDAFDYDVTFTLAASAGGVTPSVGGVAGTLRTVPGTYTETITAGASALGVEFTPQSAFVGSVDNVSVKLK